MSPSQNNFFSIFLINTKLNAIHQRSVPTICQLFLADYNSDHVFQPQTLGKHHAIVVRCARWIKGQRLPLEIVAQNGESFQIVGAWFALDSSRSKVSESSCAMQDIRFRFRRDWLPMSM
jgi:hypothetical protein